MPKPQQISYNEFEAASTYLSRCWNEYVRSEDDDRVVDVTIGETTFRVVMRYESAG